MSHFPVMIIGENPEEQLKPFDENLRTEWNDKTNDYKEEYETKKTSEFYCGSNSSWGYQITKELFDFIKNNKIGAIKRYEHEKQTMHYLTNGKKYRGYYTLDGGKRCDGDAWFEVISVNKTSHPDSDVCFEGIVTIRVIEPPKEISLKDKYPDYETYLTDWHGIDDVEKQGYWNNPNAKWDWYQLGGRWSGLIKLKDGKNGVVGNSGTFGNKTGIDQAKKCDIANFEDIITHALIKDGKWYEKGEMGWWGIVHDEKNEWDKEFVKLVSEIPDETLISIYDCHI